MAYTPLTAGYNIVIQQKVGEVNTPIYPITKTANVKDSTGKDLDAIIAGLAAIEDAVPSREGQTASSLVFLRNDKTWAEIQSASTSQKGVVQLTSVTNSESEELAATAKAVKTLKDEIDALDTTIGEGFVRKTQLGAASTTVDDVTTVGVATLDAQGKVPAAQLPSYVDDVVEVKIAAGNASATLAADDSAVTPETGKIYVDVTNNKTYRWSGSTYVEISESLALGETESTAFAGNLGKIAYDHSQEAHANVNATVTAASTTNGYIKIDDVETLVYTHASHTAAESGLYKVTVDAEGHVSATTAVTKEDITALDIPAQDTTYEEATVTAAGLMSATDKAKVDNCMQTAVSATAPSFTNGLWFQIVSED